VWAVRLDAAGNRIGKEFRVSDPQEFTWVGREPAITPFGSGVVFFWYENGTATQHVLARLHDPDGTPRGTAFEVGASTSDPFMDGVMLADGGFMLGWGGTTTNTAGDAHGRSYLPNGQPRGDEFTFSTATKFRRLAVSPDGTTVAMVGVRSNSQVWARRFTVDGTPLADEFVVYDPLNPNRFVNPDVEFDLAGNLYVAWTESDVGIRARGFGANDVPLGPPITTGSVGAYALQTARLTDGRFVNVESAYQFSVQATIVSLCTPGTSVCGDGVLRSECELCDDGAANSDTVADACRTTCRPAGCGDGVVDTGEECDDGNVTSCDGCSEFCRVEVGLGCGDGVPNAACGEPCDDGNTVTGDGCSPSCALERVPGGGPPLTDCYTEWVADNAANDPLLEGGAFRRVQTCTDGDPRCDFDPTPGVCGFHVRVCANDTDRPGCTAGSRLASWQLRQPSAGQAARRPAAAAARAALLAAVPSAIVGPAERDVCSDVAEVPVALHGVPGQYHVGKLGLKTTATLYDGSYDTDTLKLLCLPAVAP
jgi:cysteine-rich repeat protein